MKSWKKRWETELDSMIPALSEEVKNEPIPVRESVTNVQFKETVSPTPWYMQLFSTPRRIASCLSACAIGLIAVGASLYFAMRPDAPLTAEAEVISVEVNPQAVFSVDKNGNVTAVVAANDDADVILSENRAAEMEGKTVEEAVKIFVDYTAQLGYLDLENPDAVRVTSCVGNGYLNEVSTTLKNYFKGIGSYVAVVEETVEIETFCQRVNMEISDTVETLKSSIERIPTLSFEREVEGKEGEELQSIYRENVSVEDMKDIFLSSVSEGVQKIEKFKEIDELSDAIRQHDDNPGAWVGVLYLKDYWSIKDKEVPDTMSALMAEMAEKLSAYEANYGVKIQDMLDLTAERANCSAATLQVLTETLLNYTLELFEQNFTVIVGVLETLNIDTSMLTELYELPETAEEYMQKLGDYTQTRYEMLQEEYRVVYETERVAISEEDYEIYISNLIEEHGSLSKYFENM